MNPKSKIRVKSSTESESGESERFNFLPIPETSGTLLSKHYKPNFRTLMRSWFKIPPHFSPLQPPPPSPLPISHSLPPPSTPKTWQNNSKAYIDVVDTSGAGVSLLGGSPGGAILPVQMRQFRSKRWMRCSSVVSSNNVLELVLLSGRPFSTFSSALALTEF